MKKLIIIKTIILLIISSLFSIDYEKIAIGYSIKNNPIELYKFNKGKELLILLAGIHGNESNTSKTLVELIELLKQDIIKIPENKSLWIIPKLNPDGLLRDRRLNENNIDLNRNFDTDNWQPTFYFFNILLNAGKRPFSEPETKALEAFFKSIDPKYKPIILSLHSRGDLIIPGNNSPENKNLALFLEKNSTYTFDTIGYNTTGDLTAWLSDKLKIPSATIEFKSKEKTELNEIKRIVFAFMKTDFKKIFYNSGISVATKQIKSKELIKSLPQETQKKITGQADIKNFMELYKKIQFDDELLLLVNKTHKLERTYIPNDLIKISDEFYDSTKSFMLREILINDLTELFNSAKKDGVNLSIISAYRSYETQENLFKYWQKVLGEEKAKMVSALPGASQHQLGTTIDLNSLEPSFGETNEGIWLAKNAYKFGFIMSYPKGQEELTGYSYEPWHYRYIGKDAAYLVYNYFDNLIEIFLNWYWDRKIES